MNDGLPPVTIGVAVRYENPGALRRFVHQLAEAAHLLDAHTESEVCFCLNGASTDTKRYLDEALRDLSDPELRFQCIESPPGKIRAHSAIASHRQLHGHLLFVDADITYDPSLFLELFSFMQSNPNAYACYAEVEALPSIAGGVFARLQNAYYRNRDGLKSRTHLHGRCFMVRSWFREFEALHSANVDPNTSCDSFELHLGPVVDDIHYSRVLVHRCGLNAIACVPGARVRFIPPHSAGELYRDSCRTELELCRLDLLFPEHAHLQNQVFRVESALSRCWSAFRRAGLSTAAYVVIESMMRWSARRRTQKRKATLSEAGISATAAGSSSGDQGDGKSHGTESQA